MKPRSRAAQLTAVSIALLMAALSGLLLVRLNAPAPLDRTDREVVADALPRLRFLRGALEDGAAERMQRLFPEGYFFSYALYGLAWTQVGRRDPGQAARALAEARWALDHVDSSAGRASFEVNLQPPYGVFYVGWSTWLLGGIVALAGLQGTAAPETGRLRADGAALAAAFDRSETPFLQAYPGQAWPVDSAVGIAAVRLALGDPATPTVRRWLAATERRRDPKTGLLPHTADPETGAPTDIARATSQTVLLRFLREVAPAIARRDWTTFIRGYSSDVPGVPGIREYPHGTDRSGDVDSGPLVLGLTASASVVAIGDATLFGDRVTARALSGIAEAAGMPFTWSGRRRYLGGQVPVGDAFLVWSATATGWVEPADPPYGQRFGWWRLPWYLVVGWLGAPLWITWAGLYLNLIRSGYRGAAPRTPVSSR